MKVRTLIVDDESLARERLRQLLQDEPEIELMGECADGTEAWARIQQGDISLAVLDMKMPGLHGLEVLSRMADKQYRIHHDDAVVGRHQYFMALTDPSVPKRGGKGHASLGEVLHVSYVDDARNRAAAASE